MGGDGDPGGVVVGSVQEPEVDLLEGVVGGFFNLLLLVGTEVLDEQEEFAAVLVFEVAVLDC